MCKSMSVIDKLFSHRAAAHGLRVRPAVFAGISVCGVAILTVISAIWIDRPLARTVARWLPPGHRIPPLPDQLALFVTIVSGTMLVLWIWTWSRGHQNDRLAHLAPMLTVGMPLAYGLKELAKWTYGRTETRMFLSTSHSCDFCHWLNGFGPYAGFPSGHMLVITTLVVLINAFYPRLRYYTVAILIALALALIVTSYHFLGDVLGGWIFGYLLARLILHADGALRSATARRKPA